MERLTAQQVYDNLVKGYGKPRWWPGTPYEIMVSAILVQNTAWTQVEKVFAAWGEPEPAKVLTQSERSPNGTAGMASTSNRHEQ